MATFNCGIVRGESETNVHGVNECHGAFIEVYKYKAAKKKSYSSTFHVRRVSITRCRLVMLIYSVRNVLLKESNNSL